MFSILEVSKFTGLLATAVLSANLLLGILIATRYKKTAWWHRLPLFVKKIGLFTLHNITAYVGLALAVLHPVLLLFEEGHRYSIITIFFPINAPAQPWINALGTAALFLLLVVVITSIKKVRKSITFRRWKVVHLAAYAAAVLFLIHGLLINTELKDQAVDLFDAERMVSFFSFIFLLVAAVFRIIFYQKEKRKRSVAIIKSNT
ncbi:MAG: ferric reductase-like transmembrane domain-containing protein [Chitinophagaceae bacterium]